MTCVEPLNTCSQTVSCWSSISGSGRIHQLRAATRANHHNQHACKSPTDLREHNHVQQCVGFQSVTNLCFDRAGVSCRRQSRLLHVFLKWVCRVVTRNICPESFLSAPMRICSGLLSPLVIEPALTPCTSSTPRPVGVSSIIPAYVTFYCQLRLRDLSQEVEHVVKGMTQGFLLRVEEPRNDCRYHPLPHPTPTQLGLMAETLVFDGCYLPRSDPVLLRQFHVGTPSLAGERFASSASSLSTTSASSPTGVWPTARLWHSRRLGLSCCRLLKATRSSEKLAVAPPHAYLVPSRTMSPYCSRETVVDLCAVRGQTECLPLPPLKEADVPA